MPYIIAYCWRTVAEWARRAIRAERYYFRHILCRPQIRREIRALRNRHQDRSVLVFANGPSLAKLDPEKVRRLQRDRGFHVIAINAYLNSDFGRAVTPDYYVLSDPNYWTGHVPEHQIVHLSETQRAHARQQEARTAAQIWDLLRIHDIGLFVPADRYEQTEHARKYPFCDFSFSFFTNVTDISRPLGVSSLSIYKALAIACYLGYQKIYICGVDNSQFKTFSVDRDNNVLYEIRHYYDDGRSEFIKYRTRTSIFLFLYHFSFYFSSLEKFKSFPIVNLDPDGLVDCFSKSHDLDVYRQPQSQEQPRIAV
jgi:hypothetical protein